MCFAKVLLFCSLTGLVEWCAVQWCIEWYNNKLTKCVSSDNWTPLMKSLGWCLCRWISLKLFNVDAYHSMLCGASGIQPANRRDIPYHLKLTRHVFRVRNLSAGGADAKRSWHVDRVIKHHLMLPMCHILSVMPVVLNVLFFLLMQPLQPFASTKHLGFFHITCDRGNLLFLWLSCQRDTAGLWKGWIDSPPEKHNKSCHCYCIVYILISPCFGVILRYPSKSNLSKYL